MRCSIFGFICLVLVGCSPVGSSHPSDDGEEFFPYKVFFPLQMGAQWTYKLVQGDVAVDSLRQFTVKVTGTKTVDGKEYFVVENYFLPAPLSSDKRLLRKNGNHIYTWIRGQEHLLYSFSEEEVTWTVPRINRTKVPNPSLLFPMPAKRTLFTSDTAAIAWNLRGFPRSNPTPGHVPGTEPTPVEPEQGWGELFVRGKGRTQLVWISYAYGTRVWELVDISTE